MKLCDCLSRFITVLGGEPQNKVRPLRCKSGKEMTTNFTDAYLIQLSRTPVPITQPIFKIGGNPIFLAETMWPHCERCGKEMIFLAQIPLLNPISFSTTFQMAYLFMCVADDRRYQCYPWEAYSGANRVILQTGEKQIVGTPSQPSPYPDYKGYFQQAQETTFYPKDEGKERISDTSKRNQPSEQTKLGGIPAWVQYDETPSCHICHKPMRLLIQIDAALDGTLPMNFYQYPQESFLFLDFGDAGLGYVFICPTTCSPQSAAFLWQST